MLEIDRSVSAAVDAAPQRCIATLRDVERYPQWAELVSSVEVVERDATGIPSRVRVHARALGIGLLMDCALELSENRALLTRLPYDTADHERFVTDWTLAPGEVRLHVTAALDVPGPARLLRGKVERKLADELLADFASAV